MEHNCNEWTPPTFSSGYSVHAYELLQVPQIDSSAPTPASLSRPGTQATTTSLAEHKPKGGSSPPLQSHRKGDILRSTSQGDLLQESEICQSGRTTNSIPAAPMSFTPPTLLPQLINNTALLSTLTALHYHNRRQGLSLTSESTNWIRE